MIRDIYVIAGTLLVVALIYLLRNVFKRIGQAAKYVVMPNKYDIVKKEVPLKFIPLAMFGGGISFKLIAYVIVFAIIGTVCFGLYKKITATTYSSDYKNTISHNQDVIVDQRVGGNTGCNVELAFGLVKIGCKQAPVTKIVNNGVVDKKDSSIVKKQIESTPKPKVETPKKTSIAKKSWKVIMMPINGLRKIMGVK